MTNNSLINKLPVWHRTPILTSFFKTTVDPLFTNGSVDNISGYIGRKPSYYDSVRDFYKQEPDVERASEQLEAAVVAYDTSGTLTHLATMDAWRNWLKANGAPADNDPRQYCPEYWSWCPPIDVDKFLNFRYYVWAPSDTPAVTIKAPRNTYVSNSSTVRYQLPAAITQIASNLESPAVFVNSIAVPFTRDGEYIVLQTAPYAGMSILVFRYSDLALAINGQTTFSLTGLATQGPATLTSGLRVLLDDARTLGAFEGAPYEVLSWNTQTSLSGVLFVDGVGSSITLTADSGVDQDSRYICIDRSSPDHNPWSIANRWVHRDSVQWSNLTLKAASRPIIEFNSGLELYQYGFNRLPNIDAVMTTSARRTDLNQTITYDLIDGSPVDTVIVDGGHLLRAGERILIRSPLNEQMAQHVYNILVTPFIDSNNTTTNVYRLVPAAPPLSGDIVKLPIRGLVPRDNGAIVYYDKTPAEYYFRAGKWHDAQSLSIRPLFALYDGNENYLDDVGSHPNSTFVGTSLFRYAVPDNNNIPDEVLGFPVVYDERGNIVFEDRLATATWADTNGEIKGYKYFASRRDTVYYNNGWHRVFANLPLTPTPLALEANPLNDEPTFVSESLIFDQLTSIILSQQGFSGAAYSSNNYRDTQKDISLGRHILQHRASLLRPLLLASDSAFDPIEAIRFAAKRYTRFRGSYIAKANQLREAGALATDADADTIALQTLTAIAGANVHYLSIIPATPSAMKLTELTKPVFVDDNSFVPTISFLRGHDNSLTPLSGDWKDTALFGLERAIYNNSGESNNTVNKQLFALDKAALYQINSWSRAEINDIFRGYFEQWCKSQSIEYRTNNNFSDGDPFSFNWTGTTLTDGSSAPGNWRAIYRYLYGTETPHLTPWEMLGFVEMPSWWQNTYGSAPYTSENTTLWHALATGIIGGGPQQGNHSIYVRSWLPNCIPVDDAGDLLDPLTCGAAKQRPSAYSARSEWVFGDGSPIESLWRKSVEFNFDIIAALLVLAPAATIEDGWSPSTTIRSLEHQLVDSVTMKRPQAVLPSTTNWQPDVGLARFIVDRMTAIGDDPMRLAQALSTLDVRLVHRMAGFTSSDRLRLAADDFGMLPAEDVKVELYKTQPRAISRYSGIIIEKVTNGYRLYGYDPFRPWFDLALGNEDGRREKLVVEDNQPSVFKWQPNTSYVSGVYAEYNRSVYRATRSHLSNSTFEQQFWVATPEILNHNPPQYYRLVDSANVSQKYHYGSICPDKQSVCDVLFAYERNLIASGFVFTQDRDWKRAALSFLDWSRVSWENGNFVALSPAARQLDFSASYGSAVDVERERGGIWGLLDRQGRPIEPLQTEILRSDGDLSIAVPNADIFAAAIGVSEIEHALVISNKTIFGDIIYYPLFDLRQPRLKMRAKRSQNWNGRLEAPGYIVTAEGIAPSFAKAADDIGLMFDIEKADDTNLRDYARHLIGFETRDYLTRLGMSDTQQFEFYQGMIQIKGATESFTRLQRSTALSQSSTLGFREEWAFLAGEFGASRPTARAAFSLQNADGTREPLLIDLTQSIDKPGIIGGAINAASTVVFETGAIPPTTLGNSSSVIPMSAPVRIEDAAATAMSLDAIDVTLLQTLNAGQRIWTHGDRPDAWNIQEVNALSNDRLPNTANIIYGVAEIPSLIGARIFMTRASGLQLTDVGLPVIIKTETRTDGDLSGLWFISAVASDGSYFEINTNCAQGRNYPTQLEVGPEITILRPARFTSPAFLPAGRTRGSLAWVDDNGSGRYAVYQFGSSWSVARVQPDRVDTSKNVGILVRNRDTVIGNHTTLVNPVIIPRVEIVDPLQGMVSGIALRQIEYILDRDPASYTDGVDQASRRPWGSLQEGRLWWDITTVRYLNCLTDDSSVASGDTLRNSVEMEYRTSNWGKIAPGTIVDLYEWFRSEVVPANYSTKSGDIYYNGEVDPLSSYVTGAALDANNVLRACYWFWVKSRTQPPLGEVFSANTLAKRLSQPDNSTPWLGYLSSTLIALGGINETISGINPQLEIETRINDYAGNSHKEWQLIGLSDSKTAVPNSLWLPLRDALVGFDDQLNAVKATDKSDIRARSKTSMFAGKTVLARTSFIKAFNELVSGIDLVGTRIDAIERLLISTPVSLYLTQRNDGINTSPLPPLSEYDNRVIYSARDFASLLDTPTFMSAWGSNGFGVASYESLTWEFSTPPAGRKPRVLMNRLPRSWSVWEFLPQTPPPYSANGLLMIADTVFSPALAYDYTVANRAGLGGLDTIQNGDRVYVVSDETANGFWTILKCDTNTTSGYSLVQMQSYRVSDFITRIDWYDAGYSSVNMPPVRYATKSERDFSENANPRNIFVRVDNDGDGNWAWYVKSQAGWNRVAAGLATLAINLSAAQIGNQHALGVGAWAFDPNAVASRDVGFDLKAIIDVLLNSNILTITEMNSLYEAMIHTAHVINSEIPWATKTSFMTIDGYDEPLLASPVSTTDTSQSLLDYVEEVKPYRVKIRAFERSLAPAIDIGETHTTDFDKSPYLDKKTSHVRVLDETKDRNLISPEYLIALASENASGPTLRRSIETTILIDRFGGGEAEARLQYYAPTQLSPPNKASALLGLDFRAVAISGGSMSGLTSGWGELPMEAFPYGQNRAIDFDVDYVGGDFGDSNYELLINPVTGPTKYGFVDPFFSSGFPAEAAPLRTMETLYIEVTKANNSNFITVNSTGWNEVTAKYCANALSNTDKTITITPLSGWHDAILSCRNYAVWLDGERIEFTSISPSGNNLILGGVRRGTRRTVAQPHAVGTQIFLELIG